MNTMPSLHGAISKTSVEFSISFITIVADLLGIYYQCLTLFYKATWQEKWISAIKELETLHTCKPAVSTNGCGYLIEVHLLQKLNFRNDRGKKIYIIQWYLQNRFIPSRLTKNGTMIEFVFQTANIYARNN